MKEDVYRMKKLDTLSRIGGVFLFAVGTERLTQGHLTLAAVLMVSGFILAIITIPFSLEVRDGEWL